MNLQFHSSVIICQDFDKMKDFYLNILQQEVEVDFGNCIGLKCKISLWQLKDNYPIAEKLGRTFSTQGNKNLEICFETDDFETIVNHLKHYDINYLHKEEEETWGQRTLRLFDPENNLIEIGETVPCFVKRFYQQGLSIEEVSQRTAVPLEMVKEIISFNCKQKN